MKRIIKKLFLGVVATLCAFGCVACDTFAKKMNYELTSTGEYMLVNVGNLEEERITIPATYDNTGKRIVSIRTKAFLDCKTVKKLVIEDGGVRDIGGEAFSGCVNLEEVILGNGVTTIGGEAFENCEKLKEIYIPATITNIGADAFKGCSSLTIYCEAAEPLGTFSQNWHGGCKVVWSSTR